MKRLILYITIQIITVCNVCAQQSSFEIADQKYADGINAFNGQKYNDAIALFSECDSINKVFARQMPYYSSNASQWVAYSYHILGEDTIARSICPEFLFEPIDQRLTIESDSISYLAYIAIQNQDIDKASKYGKQAMELESQILGPNHYSTVGSEYISVLSEIVNGNYDVVIPHLEHYVKVVSLIDPKYPDLLSIKNQLLESYDNENIKAATIYRNGNYEDAANIEYSVIKGIENIYETNSTQYIVALNNYAYFISRSGDYIEAKQYWDKALNIELSTLGIHNSLYVTIMGNIAQFYSHIGEYKKSIEIYESLKQLMDEDAIYNDQYLTNLRELAVTIQNQGIKDNYPKALELLKYVYTKRRSDNMEDAYNLYLSTTDLITSYNLNEFSDSALTFVPEAEDLLFRVYGQNSCEHAKFLVSVGSLFLKCQKSAIGLSYEEQGIKIFEKIYGKNLFPYINYLSIVGYDLIGAKYYNKGVDYLIQAIQFKKNRIEKELPYLTQSEKYNYWVENKPNFRLPIALSIEKKDSTLAKLAYDIALFSKELLLNSSLCLTRIAQENNDQTISSLIDELHSSLIKIRNETQYEKYDSLSLTIDNLSQQLSSHCAAYGSMNKIFSCNYKQIREKLHKNDVAIEFVCISDNSIPSICATIIKKDWCTPKCFYVSRIDSLLKKIKNKDINGQYREIWKFLLEDAEIQEGDNIYFSPDGILNQIGIEYLPTEDGRFMADKYNMLRVSSTRILCDKKNDTINSAVLYGGLKYDTDIELMKIVSSKYNANNARCPVGDVFSKIINSSCDSKIKRFGISYLYETLLEVDSIEHIFKESKGSNVSVIKYSNEQGSEESFKNLSGKSPRLLHIATHGFYLNKTIEEIESQAITNNNPMSVDLLNRRKKNVIDYSMERTGLMFSGAANRFKGAIPNNIEDGLLTANEISQLDLSNVDLAVLSACDTGGGDITADGVAGLQRGFKNAGVKSLLMSLWKVDDQATKLLMIQFYRNLMSGHSKMDSLREAQRYVRNYTQDGEQIFSDPEYWASFILLDGID